jgi:hypothetical protein
VPQTLGHLTQAGQFSVLRPSNRQLSPKLRTRVEFLSKQSFAE